MPSGDEPASRAMPRRIPPDPDAYPHEAAVWRRERDSNPRYRFRYSGFQDHRHRPLGHPSAGTSKVTSSKFKAKYKLSLTCGSMTSRPPMNGRSASGMTTEPSLLLVVLQHRDQGAADGQARPVQRVHELGLAGAVRPELDVRAPGLEAPRSSSTTKSRDRSAGSAATPRCRRSSPPRSPCRRCTASPCDSGRPSVWRICSASAVSASSSSYDDSGAVNFTSSTLSN